MAKGVGGSKNEGTLIVVCDCASEYQDQKYGRQRRVKNKCNKGFRCSVCGKEG